MKKFLMVFCIMSLIFVVSNMATAAPVQWAVGDGGNGHWYDVIDMSSTWQEAKVLSESMGGYLATLTSQEEDEFVYNNLVQPFSNNYWLGGTDEAVEGVWQWITGEAWDYTNWAAGEPNDGTGSGQDYLNIYASGVWDDAGPPGWPDDSLPFVIEWNSKPVPMPCRGDFDHDGDVDASDLAVFSADFGRTDCPACIPAPVPATGQQNSYAERDDGDLQLGVKWPDPRFTDNLDGTGPTILRV